jgi:hypothetical protein
MIFFMVERASDFHRSANGVSSTALNSLGIHLHANTFSVRTRRQIFPSGLKTNREEY